MNKFYQCFDGMHIPLIEIQNDKVLVRCPFSKKVEKFEFDIFCDKYIKTCSFCENSPVFYREDKLYCKKCISINNYSKRDYKNIFNLYICSNHRENYIAYCGDCDRNLCQQCMNKHQTHHYKPDKNFYNNIKTLEEFICNLKKKIQESKEILDKLEAKINIYESLLIRNNYVITKEKIINFENLKIINNINENQKIFINNINKINNELKSLLSFDYNNIFKQNLKNDEIDLNKKKKIINECNFQKNSSFQIINLHSISIINGIIYLNNKNGMKNSMAFAKKDNLNKSINLVSKTKNILESSNNKENAPKIFKESIMNLYERYSLKKENIENKMKYIINKIINICYNLEDSKKMNERNIFIFSIGHIAREAVNFSYDLAEILLKKFYENHNFSSIIYEKAKIEFSSWVNQSLCFLDNNKDFRVFFDIYCKKEINRIKKYLKNEQKIEQFYNDINFNFTILFRDLSQLYTEVLLCSEKSIQLKFIKDKDYKSDSMKDINDKKYGRFVKCTILPGLFVNNKIINNGKILVFCGNKNSSNDYIPNYDTPNHKELEFKNTIKDSNLSEIKCNLIYDEENFKFIIITNPKIPANDHPKYSLELTTGKEIQSKENQNEFNLNDIKLERFINLHIIGTVELNGKKLYSEENYRI